MGRSSEPKQWEIRAALRAMERSRESSARNPAEALVAAANELVAESDDFTVKQVAERAGVALQTFYRHFGSKDELVLAVLEDLVADGVDGLVAEVGETEDPVERLRRLVQAPFRAVVTDQTLRQLAWRARERQRLTERFPREVQTAYDPYRSAVSDALRSAQAAGLIDSEDPALDAMLIQQQVRTSYHLLSSHGTEYTPEQLGRRVWELTWRGLAARGPRGASCPPGG